MLWLSCPNGCVSFPAPLSLEIRLAFFKYWSTRNCRSLSRASLSPSFPLSPLLFLLPLPLGSLHRSVPLSPRQARGGERGCCNSHAQVRGPRRALPPGTAPAAAADSPLEIMCCGRERLSRPRRSAGAGTAQQPGATTPVSQLRRACAGSGDASALPRPAWLTRRALPHSLPFFLFALSPFPPLLFLSVALRMWKQPSCLSLHGTSLCHPLHHRAQEGSKRAAALEEEDQVCRNGTTSSSLPAKI